VRTIEFLLHRGALFIDSSVLQPVQYLSFNNFEVRSIS